VYIEGGFGAVVTVVTIVAVVTIVTIVAIVTVVTIVAVVTIVTIVAIVTVVTQLTSLIYKLYFILQINILSEFPVADLKMCDIAK